MRKKMKIKKRILELLLELYWNSKKIPTPSHKILYKKNTLQPQDIVVERILAGAIRIELISLVLETKAQPLYQTPKQRSYYITKKTFCQLFFC